MIFDAGSRQPNMEEQNLCSSGNQTCGTQTGNWKSSSIFLPASVNLVFIAHSSFCSTCGGSSRIQPSAWNLPLVFARTRIILYMLITLLSLFNPFTLYVSILAIVSEKRTTVPSVCVTQVITRETSISDCCSSGLVPYI